MGYEYVPESAKPQTIQRRTFQGFLPLAGRGIDVGAGRDLRPEWRWWEQLGMSCDPWDVQQGDAHFLAGVEDEQYDWLFSSHCLEHLQDPDLALRNWRRVVRPGGLILLAVPHRNLYERRRTLPSWNREHLRFYLPYQSDGPGTVGMWEWLTAFPGLCLLRLATGDWGNTNPQGLDHPDGEFQIDALLERLP